MLVMTFPKSKKSHCDYFFDEKFFKLMYQFLHSKFFWKRRLARRELCRTYVVKFREISKKTPGVRRHTLNNLLEEFEGIEKAKKILVVRFIDLVMEEEAKK